MLYTEQSLIDGQQQARRNIRAFPGKTLSYFFDTAEESKHDDDFFAAEKYDIIYPGNVYTDENGHTKATHLLFCGMPSELMFVFWLVTFTTTVCSSVGFAFAVSVFTSAPQRGHDFAFLFSIFAPHCLQT